ncbi:MAG: septum formation initiator family protein, partial [Candidatus Atribacteria bacterium]|nr:septum formation initiator family protein [Candidatus Atribacteria bacterium]
SSVSGKGCVQFRMISIKSVFQSKIVWILILLLLFYTTYIFSDKYARILQLKEDIKELETEIEKLELRNKDLSEEVDCLSKKKSIEKIAREELGLTKPDEILIKGIEK